MSQESHSFLSGVPIEWKITAFKEYLRIIRFKNDTEQLFSVKFLLWLIDQSENLTKNVFAVFPNEELELYSLVKNNVHYLGASGGHIHIEHIISTLEIECDFVYYGSSRAQKSKKESGRTIGLWEESAFFDPAEATRPPKIVYLEQKDLEEIKNIKLQ